MLNIYNFPFKNITSKKFSDSLKYGLKNFLKLQNISIIFVNRDDIKKLNKEYRNTDEVTDVLSFNYDSQDLLGEVYICKDYIYTVSNGIEKFEELVRLCVHGILHLYGYDHTEKFIDRKQTNLENMYVIQESILDNVMKKLK